MPVLFLVADTGGGHRAAARAISEELGRAYPGVFAPVLCDPLGGPGSAGLLRWICGLYGPAVRLVPWLWGVVWHITNSRPAMRVLRMSLLALANRPVAAAVARHRPAVIVSLHPLTGAAAVAARDRLAPATPVVTVVTDLVTPHAAWRGGAGDLVLAPAAARGPAGHGPHRRLVPAGLPVAAAFRCSPAGARERAALRRSLGLDGRRFLVVLTGGAEGCGGMTRRAKALIRRFDDVHVVAICGRNRRLRRRLDRLAARSPGRLTVRGSVGDMADWLRCADVVAGKADPGTTAEATCCGAPLILTSQLPGQEKGNAAFVTAAGAGRYAPGVRMLVAEIGRLRARPQMLDAMRAASARLGRPGAAPLIAARLAEITRVPGEPGG
jgi:1,2-diacylglycerol 3-beta-galactosyltransferase